MGTELTPETRAIIQHLSKERPGCHACGCLGPAPIDRGIVDDATTYDVTITNFGPRRMEVVKTIREVLRLRLVDVKPLLSAETHAFEQQRYCYPIGLVNDIRALGADVDVKKNEIPREPLCRCAMAWVELVDGVYYRVDEHRSTTGITHTATELGPVGGPYKNIR